MPGATSAQRYFQSVLGQLVAFALNYVRDVLGRRHSSAFTRPDEVLPWTFWDAVGPGGANIAEWKSVSAPSSFLYCPPFSRCVISESAPRHSTQSVCVSLPPASFSRSLAQVEVAVQDGMAVPPGPSDYATVKEDPPPTPTTGGGRQSTLGGSSQSFGDLGRGSGKGGARRCGGGPLAASASQLARCVTKPS